MNNYHTQLLLLNKLSAAADWLVASTGNVPSGGDLSFTYSKLINHRC